MTAEELAAIKAHAEQRKRGCDDHKNVQTFAESWHCAEHSNIVLMSDQIDALIAEVERLRTKELWRPYFRATIKLAGRPLVIRYFESEAEATAYLVAFRAENFQSRGPVILRQHIERSDAWASEP